MRKIEVERLNHIDISTIKNNGWLIKGNIKIQLEPSSNMAEGSIDLNLDNKPSIHFTYVLIDEMTQKKKTYDSLILLATTPCHFGNCRYWFKCPNCDKRAKKLYEYGNLDLCRTCLNLTYESRNMNRKGKRGIQNRFFDLQDEVESLKEKAIRQTWKGIPTKKQQRIKKLQRQILAYCDHMELRGVV